MKLISLASPSSNYNARSLRLALGFLLVQCLEAFSILPWSPDRIVLRRSQLQRHHVSMGFTESDSSKLESAAVAVQEKSTTKDSKKLSSTKDAVDEDDWARQVAKTVFANTTNPILLFDGVCNLCNEAVNLCLDLDDEGTFRYASIQSRVGQALLIQNGRDPEDRSTMVVVTAVEKEMADGHKALEYSCYTQSDAVLRIATELQGLPESVRWSAKAASMIVPQWFRDAMLKFVSKNRFLLGETDGPTCRLDLDGIYESRFLEDPDLV